VRTRASSHGRKAQIPHGLATSYAHSAPPRTRRSTTHNRERVSDLEPDSTGPARVPIRCPNPRGFPVKAGEPSSHLLARTPPVSSDFVYGIGAARSACHAEGRGFESHQPLPRRPAFAGLFRGSRRLVRVRRRAPNGYPGGQIARERLRTCRDRFRAEELLHRACPNRRAAATGTPVRREAGER
jgi:hypothetical protein